MTEALVSSKDEKNINEEQVTEELLNQDVDGIIISLANERETSYSAYITVQNELVAAYNTLRNRRALQIGPQKGFADMDFVAMQKNYKNVQWVGNKEKLKAVIDQIKVEIPQKLSEVQ